MVTAQMPSPAPNMSNLSLQKSKSLLLNEMVLLASEPIQNSPSRMTKQSYQVENDRIIVNVVGINFAMLDFLGTDVHMAAALIGHELAHIKLEHGKNRDKKRDTATFSVDANTLSQRS